MTVSGSLGAVGLLIFTLCSASLAGEIKPLRIGSDAQIFVDDVFVAAKEGVIRKVHPARKLARPVLEPDRPWEGGRVYLFGSVYYDADAKRFVMWYSSYPPQGKRDKRLSRTRRALVNYATSKDGLRWIKPNLGLYSFRGSKRNNIVYDLENPSVIVDTMDPDSSKRYKMAGLAEGNMFWVASSPDGIHWKDDYKNLFRSDDTLTWTRSPYTGEYLVFHKKDGYNIRGMGRRTVFLAASEKIENLTAGKLVLGADETDDLWVKEPGQKTEFYDMSAFAYGGQFLGIAATFRHTRRIASPKPDQSPDDGPIHGQLVHSRDGHTWNRLDDRTPVIPTGPAAFDAGCILGMANTPVLVDNEIWLYYTAVTTTHGGAMPEKRITLGRAAWRMDGFVSIDAAEKGGMLETVLLELDADQLIVNADAADGCVTVEVLDEQGKILPGYSQRDCLPIETDSIRHTVKWKGQDRLPIDQPLRLRFHLKSAKLYSYRVTGT